VTLKPYYGGPGANYQSEAEPQVEGNYEYSGEELSCPIERRPYSLSLRTAAEVHHSSSRDDQYQSGTEGSFQLFKVH
jgi:hypothetical protein